MPGYRIHLVETTPTDQGGVPVPLYFSDWGFTTTPTDADAPNRNYLPLARQPFSFRSSLPLDQILGTQAETSAGNAILENGEGQLDPYLGLIWDGATYRVLRGPSDGAYADFTRVFAGRVQAIEGPFRTEVTLRLRDPREFLQLPITLNTYAGTGGLEGPEALTGAFKPRCWGFRANITPVLVDPSTLTYQVHDGPVAQIVKVYDRGDELHRVDSAPGLGYYQAIESQGIFILGGVPSGAITADVLGDGDDGDGTATERRYATRILRRILAEFYPDVARDDASFLAEAQPFAAGLYLSERRTFLDILPEMLAGQGSVLVFSPAGLATIVTPRFDVAPLAAVTPLATPEGHLEIELLAVPPPAWRLQLGVAKNGTVLRGTEVAAIIDGAARQVLGLPYQIVIRQDETVRALHPFAADPPLVPTALASIDAAAADRLFALVSTMYRRYRVKCWAPALTLTLANLVTLVHPRGEPELAHGVPALVATIEVDATTDAVTIEVLV